MGDFKKFLFSLSLEEERTITGNLVKKGDMVLLVMPQDIQAPKGRLILPQGFKCYYRPICGST